MRAIAIITGPETHLDHLGVLSAILEIPLIVTEEKCYRLAKEFYPGLNVHHIDHADLTLDFLASNFDVILESGKFWAAELVPMLELLFKKKMRLIYCPHGNSEKGHSLSIHPVQDISLIYGDQMKDLLAKTGALQNTSQLIRTGNYRFPFYRKHKQFYDEKILPYLYSSKKTILYAPSWSNGENPTSFFDSCSRIVNSLCRDFNLIIKLHPFLEEDNPALTHYLISAHEDRALFLRDFPPIYPLLAYTDIYLGDYSSIGYDFLAFDRPMYFLSDVKGALNPCGMVIPPDQNPHDFILQTLDENQEKRSEARKNLYAYAFGEEIDPSVTAAEITAKTLKMDVGRFTKRSYNQS